MFFSPVIRRGFITAAAVVVEAKYSQQNENENTTKCRPSELPLYTPDPQVATQNGEGVRKAEPVPNFIENSVRQIRETVSKYTDEFYAYERVAKQSLTESKQNVEWLVDYLRQEDNTLPKAGAIGIGALTGLIFGLRGGFFKRTIYAATGGLGMAAVCYPKEASEYSQVAAVEGKRLLTIGYNFVYGVKKDEPPLELPSLPSVPTSFSEAWDKLKTTATSLISDDGSKVEEIKNVEKSLKK
ncbi:MICOS complex subunit MIC27 isoform X2 [Anthonomus grandis grandis]|uniref:MICOS complex subunit MIC27 isoform X2 n=1 Tax=Anthonomus grandis grandis TaxID=2921223 RepID=UPI0021657039|nr:MICOS complex subunit MIC27 isoform X2 [Anthonomus grandis grandis]